MDYPSDHLTPAERERLAPHFTDLDGPVFALVNLRLAWAAANAAHGGRAPAWFILLGLGAAALIASGMIGALTPR